MARVVKDADERRRELLETALDLFMTVGFERTSIEQITSAVGVAKGTFYHYFDSKQDLLGQLVVEWADGLFEQVERDLRDVQGDAVTRLRALFALGSELKLRQWGRTMTLSRALYTEENLRLRTRLLDEWLTRLEVILTGIIGQGQAEGVFDVDDAGRTAAILAALWYGWGERQAVRLLEMTDPAEMMAAAAPATAAFESAMERILGLPPHSLQLTAIQVAAGERAAQTKKDDQEGARK